ncbi:MAG: sulfite exporter TauE/SafE family protein [Vicinamibacterales bacterium]
MIAAALWTLVAGTVAGAFGVLLGIGGGVFLVPFLNLVLDLPMHGAAGVSLVTVIATSSVASASLPRLQLVNLRLGMLLEVFTTTGGLLGVFLVNQVDDRSLRLAFGTVMALTAVVMLARLRRRNVLHRDTDPGTLGGRFYDPETGDHVTYRLVRMPVAFLASFVAGVVSMLGIGGGVLKVPALNAWCGVPMRVAAATSSLMIGATAVVGAVNYFVRGQVDAHLAAAAVIGVLVGARAGRALGERTNVRGLKVLMAGVLLFVSALYFYRAMR